MQCSARAEERMYVDTHEQSKARMTQVFDRTNEPRVDESGRKISCSIVQLTKENSPILSGFFKITLPHYFKNVKNLAI